MDIRIKAAGHLQNKMPGRQAEFYMSMNSGDTIADLLGRLGLNKSQVWIIRVNGQHVTPDHLLADGDYVELFPLVGGG